ncbi:hypothetical protein Tco_1318688 [Tanacetum coccineum]
MSMVGKISFFLGLQISQSSRGIFININIALESLNEIRFDDCDPLAYSNGGVIQLDEDKEGKAVDPSHHRGIIGTLLYLTASRPDLQFAICMCARMEADYIDLSGCCAQFPLDEITVTYYGVGFNKILTCIVITKALLPLLQQTIFNIPDQDI